MRNEIDDGFERAKALLTIAEDDMSRLPRPVATFLLVCSAQGVIDNGGYCYFFGADWLGSPTYSEFIEAYGAIGCNRQASELARVVATFPFANAHLDPVARKAFMKEHYDKSSGELPIWGDDLCGDKEVWEKLGKYYQANCSSFA